MKADVFELPVPTEDDEQYTFVEWLDLVGLRYTSIPNHTYNPWKSQQNKNRRLGLRKGFPDMIVLINPHRSKDGEGHLLAIEMKRKKGGKVDPEQAKWLGALTGLESPNIHATVAKGADQAIEFVNQYLRPEPHSIF